MFFLLSLCQIIIIAMKYFIIENNQQQGPFSIYELKDKGINSKTPVWAEGMNDWTPAGKVDELRDFLFNTNDKSTPPPYIPPKLSESEEDNPVPSKNNGHGCLIISAIILLGIIIFLAVTNPNKQQHKDAIKDKIVLALDKQADINNSIVGLGVHLVGKLFINQLSDKILDEMLDYHNYGIFSTCSVNLKEKPHTVSYGLISKIFTANEDDIANYLNENMPSIDDVIPLPEIGLGKSDNNTNEVTAAPKDTTAIVEQPNLGRDIQEEIVNSVGRIIKKEVGKNTDSVTSENVGKLIDDIINLIQ